MNVHIIIGKNFGDEGKGLATDYFALRAKQRGERCIVVRHNGGAQAGHTVDMRDGRFVFHQLSSGSLRGADTYLADSFLPDLYKLPDELDGLSEMGVPMPRLYASEMCRCVIIDDVLVNMALETSRGDRRHGSCGMGINEAVTRSARSDFCLTLGKVCASDAASLCRELKRIRTEYLPIRLKELGLTSDLLGDYGELLCDDNVLLNVSDMMCRAAERMTLCGGELTRDYDEVIFEGAQGLLLDEDCLEFAPHLTSSKTGVHNPARFADRYLDGARMELVYVTRSYVTRHGEGCLPHEELFDAKKHGLYDRTNLPNKWQGAIRYALHPDREKFSAYMLADAKELPLPHTAALFVTHLNETDGKICTVSGSFAAADHCLGLADRVYLSSSPFSEETELCVLVK